MKKQNNPWEVDNKRKKRKKKKKGGGAAKFLLFVAIIVVLLAGGVTALSYFAPEVAESYAATKYVKEEILGLTTTTTTTTTTSTTTTTTTIKESMSYMESKEFVFDPGKQGNLIGNLLNGGKVGYDSYYIYYAVDGVGVYRFEPNYEGYSKLFSTDDNLSSINLLGDYLYYINDSDHKLHRRSKSTGKNEVIAEDMKIAYVYDSKIYGITTYNTVMVMDIEKLMPTTIYSGDGELQLVGISLGRVFLTETDNYGKVKYYSIARNGKGNIGIYMPESTTADIQYLSIENGYMYYYERQEADIYNLIRQKFGSEEKVVMLEDANVMTYTTVDLNRLYYPQVEGDKFMMTELNMNTMERKVLLYEDNMSDKGDIRFFHGGEYDFIIGDGLYRSSSNLTSARTAMDFKKGSWKY